MSSSSRQGILRTSLVDSWSLRRVRNDMVISLDPRVVGASSVVRLFVGELFMSRAHRAVRASPLKRSFVRTCLVCACSCSCGIVDHSFVIAPVSSCSFGLVMLVWSSCVVRRSIRRVVVAASCLRSLIRCRLVEFVVA